MYHHVCRYSFFFPDHFSYDAKYQHHNSQNTQCVNYNNIILIYGIV